MMTGQNQTKEGQNQTKETEGNPSMCLTRAERREARRRLGGAEFGPRSPRPALRRPREREYSRSEASGGEAIRRSSR